MSWKKSRNPLTQLRHGATKSVWCLTPPQQRPPPRGSQSKHQFATQPERTHLHQCWSYELSTISATTMAGQQETSKPLAANSLSRRTPNHFGSQPRHPRATAAGAGQEAAGRRTRTPDLVVRPAPRSPEQVQGLSAMREYSICSD